MNILQVRKYNLLIKEELQSKLGLHILYQEKLFKNKQKQLKNKEKKQEEALKDLTEALESIEGLFPKNMRTDEIENERDEIKKWGNKIKQKDLNQKAGKHKQDFQQYETIRSLRESTYSGKISIYEANMDQTNVLEDMVKIGNKSKPKTKEETHRKQNTFDSVNDLYEGKELTSYAFRNGVFPIKKNKEKD